MSETHEHADLLGTTGAGMTATTAGGASATGGDAPLRGNANRNAGKSAPSHAQEPLKKTLRDPLLTRPRWSSVAWSAVLGVLLLLLAAGVWWASVRTVSGQMLDTVVFLNLHAQVPGWLRLSTSVVTSRYVIEAFLVLCGLGAVVLAIVRRRWALLVQMAVFVAAVFVAHLLKYVLPRPVFDRRMPNPGNTSPSGHTIAIATAVVLLVIAAGLAWRAWAALFAVLAIMVGGTSLVIDQWHRPSDVIVGILLTGGLALIVLAFTRGSAMDEPGTRRSSGFLQVVATLLLAGAIVCAAWGGYLLVQLWPGLDLPSRWVSRPACRAALLLIAAATLLVMGLVLAIRQSTASPLSTVGLLGGPPKPEHDDAGRPGAQDGAERIRRHAAEHRLKD